MATTIKQLLLKGTTTGVYVRTSAGAVNCDPTVWDGDAEGKGLLQIQTYIDPTDQKTSKTRLVLSEVIKEVPSLIDKKISNLSIGLNSNNELLLKTGQTTLGTVIIPTGTVIKAETISDDKTYEDLLELTSLKNDNQALSSAATMKVLDLTVGWVKNEIDNL